MYTPASTASARTPFCNPSTRTVGTDGAVNVAPNRGQERSVLVLDRGGVYNCQKTARCRGRVYESNVHKYVRIAVHRDRQRDSERRFAVLAGQPRLERIYIQGAAIKNKQMRDAARAGANTEFSQRLLEKCL